jgi:hypothetical protein
MRGAEAISLSALGGGEGWGEVGAVRSPRARFRAVPHLILNPSPPRGAEKDLRAAR